METRWYTILERAPNEDEQILVCNYPGEVFMSRKVQVEVWGDEPLQYVYEIEAGTKYEQTLDEKYIRYWMPIPATPLDIENFYPKQEFYNEEDGNVLA